MRRFVLLVLAALLFASPALADRRAEKVAKDALKKAEDDYLVTAFDKALRRLQVAERGCGETGCTAETHAALARDIGVMQLRLGQREAALASFRRAKKLDPSIALNPSYDQADLREAWTGSAPAAQPAGGDFVHTPPPEAQAVTPLAIYVEPSIEEPLSSVVVRYKAPGTSSFRRAPLKAAGKGWAGYIPCADVTLGQLAYYIQGFDKNGELVASAGAPSTPFVVVVKDTVASVPALPGQNAPNRCGEEETEKLDLLEGDRCQEDRQCKSNTCTNGRCSAPSQPDQPDETGPREWARFWVGIAGSIDFMTMPSKSEVCIAPQAQYFCTTPGGDDYPPASGNQLVPGRAGAAQGEIVPGGGHVLLTFDWAATPNVLVGARFGYVFNAYPGTTAKTLGAPVHVEVRGTYVFGDEPLTKTGLAAYAFFGAGVARFDGNQAVNVGEKTPDGRVIPGDRAVQAWLVAGPAFASIGGGARYQFSPRVAAQAGLVLTAAAFPSAFDIVAAPEMQLQYGF